MVDRASSLKEKARQIEARICELELEKAMLPRRDRRPINQKIHLLRGVLNWVETRAGYVAAP